MTANDLDPEVNMTIHRRDFLRSAALGTLFTTLPTVAAASPRSAPPPGSPRARAASDEAYEPWLELDAGALRHNAREIARVVDGRPILAVVKNNGYGLGTERVGLALEQASEVAGFAVVKPDEALALRAAGVQKPILFMGLASAETAIELARLDVRLAPFTDDAGAVLGRVAAALDRRVPIHFYIDTGISRLGMPYHRALPWMQALAARSDVTVEGTFMTFTEHDEFDAEQLARFTALVAAARTSGIPLGAVHASSSHSVFFRPEARFDGVRPGLALYGAYPSGARALGRAELRPAFRLRARVVRVERLRTGDSVSYGRNYIAERPTWIATLPVGHADGYPRNAVRGAEVLIGGRLYRVIGAVSASHTIVEVGEARTVEIGDVATLVGPDDAAIAPNTLAERAGISVYDVLMHLNPKLPVRRE
jgi:alanine racemase